jgi:hypothetical protein
LYYPDKEGITEYDRLTKVELLYGIRDKKLDMKPIPPCFEYLWSVFQELSLDREYEHLTFTSPMGSTLETIPKKIRLADLKLWNDMHPGAELGQADIHIIQQMDDAFRSAYSKL